MASRTLVSCLPWCLPPLPPGPAPTCVPCVEGRQRAAPHSSEFPLIEAPLQTLHMDVWDPARVSGQGHERYFLLVVDDYSRYTTVFPLRRKGEVTEPFAVQYAAHQINLQPRVSLPETTPTQRWTGKVGDASAFRVWGSRAFVRDTSANKLSSCAVPCGPAPSGVSQVDPVEPVEVAVDSGVARGAEPAGAGPGGAEPGVAECEGVEPGGAEPARVEPEGAEHGGAEFGCAEPEGAETERVESGGPPGVPTRPEPLSLQRLREWYARRYSRAAGATGPAAGGASGAGAVGGGAGAGAAAAAGPGAAGAAGPGGTGAVGAAGGAGAAGPGGARTRGTGAAGAGGAVGVGAVGAGAVATGGATGAGAAGGTGAGCATGVVAGDPGAEGTGAISAVSGGAGPPRPFYVPLLQQPSSPLLSSSPYSGPPGGLTERHEPESRPASPESRPELPVRTVRTGRRVPRQRPPPVPGTHFMTLRPSTAPQRVPQPSPPTSSLPDGPDPESDSLRAASPTVTVVTDPSFDSTAASTLVAELVDLTAVCRLDYAASLVAESESASVCPPSVGGECALGTDVLEDRQEEFECFATAVPHLVSMLLAPEGDPDAPDIPTQRSYAEVIEGPYSSHWQTAMDTEMASWKSTGTYVDEVPPPGANIVSGMWIFRVKRPPGSPPVFKARYVARGLSQRQGVDFFQTFSPTPKMTTLRAPCEWHDTLRTTFSALGFAPSTADPSLFLRTDTTLPLFYVLVYVDDLVFATADTMALAQVKLELQKRHTCTDLDPSVLRLYVLLATVHSSAYRSLALSSTFGQVCRAEWPVSRACGLPHVPDDLHSSRPCILARYVTPGRHRKEHMDAAMGVLRYLCSTSGMGLVLGGRARVVLTGHANASWVHELATQRSSQGYTFSLGSGSVSWRFTRSSSVLSSSCEAEIYAGAMAAQELR
ncbi:unnamed protein product [Closterium sp. NIES-54]